MMSMLCSCCVRELLILARTWFAFGLCWGEGIDATLRSRPSPIAAGQTETEQAGTPFARFGRLCVTGLICKGMLVITACNPALWEYSGDKLGV
jgi:hypothetical protein